MCQFHGLLVFLAGWPNKMLLHQCNPCNLWPSRLDEAWPFNVRTSNRRKWRVTFSLCNTHPINHDRSAGSEWLQGRDICGHSSSWSLLIFSSSQIFSFSIHLLLYNTGSSYCYRNSRLPPLWRISRNFTDDCQCLESVCVCVCVRVCVCVCVCVRAIWRRRSTSMWVLFRSAVLISTLAASGLVCCPTN